MRVMIVTKPDRKSVDLQPLVFLGGANALSEICELVNDINRVSPQYEVIGALDDNQELVGKAIFGVKVLGTLLDVVNFPNAKFVFAIGSHKTRLRRYEILQELDIPDSRFETLVHPDAKVYPTAILGDGCIVHKGAIIGNDTVLEPFVVVTFNAAIGTFNHIGRCALITTGAILTSNVHVGPCAFIGVGSVIGEGVIIGPGAMIGIGSVVLRNVKPGMFMLGNPLKAVFPSKVPEKMIHDWRNHCQIKYV